MKKFLHKKIAGFSLIEALIAALVVGLGMLGLAKLQGHLFQGNSVSRMQTNAVNSAQEKIEDLRDDEWSSLADGSDTITGANANFTRTWSISDCVPSSFKCKQVSVVMAWTDNNGVQQQIQLDSKIGNLQPVNSGVPLAGG